VEKNFAEGEKIPEMSGRNGDQNSRSNQNFKKEAKTPKEYCNYARRNR
jgi:hypothetical protein